MKNCVKKKKIYFYTKKNHKKVYFHYRKRESCQTAPPVTPPHPQMRK